MLPESDSDAQILRMVYENQINLKDILLAAHKEEPSDAVAFVERRSAEKQGEEWLLQEHL